MFWGLLVMQRNTNGDYQEEHLKEQTSSKGVLVWLDMKGLNALLVAKITLMSFLSGFHEGN